MANDTLGYQNPATVDKNLASQNLTRTTTDGTAVSTVVQREEITIGDPLQDIIANVGYNGLEVEDRSNRRLLESILVELMVLNANFQHAFGKGVRFEEGERL